MGGGAAQLLLVPALLSPPGASIQLLLSIVTNASYLLLICYRFCITTNDQHLILYIHMHPKPFNGRKVEAGVIISPGVIHFARGVLGYANKVLSRVKIGFFSVKIWLFSIIYISIDIYSSSSLQKCNKNKAYQTYGKARSRMALFWAAETHSDIGNIITKHVFPRYEGIGNAAAMY